MSTITREEFDALSRRVTALESGRPSSNGAGSAPRVEPLDDRFLSESWALKAAKRDPFGWKGESCVGVLYDECPAAWHAAMAAQCERNAEKGRNENPIRYQNKTDKKTGKPIPWFEADTFNAKLHRAWEARLSGASVRSAAPATNGGGDVHEGEFVDDGAEIPF